MHNSDEIIYNGNPPLFLWVWLHANSHKDNTGNVNHMRVENINKNLFPCYSMICNIFEKEKIFADNIPNFKVQDFHVKWQFMQSKIYPYFKL